MSFFFSFDNVILAFRFTDEMKFPGFMMAYYVLCNDRLKGQQSFIMLKIAV